MSNTTLSGKNSTMIPAIERNNKKDSFTISQAAFLLFLTLVISMTGWYLVGKYFFWTNQDVKRINKQLEYLEQQVQAKPKDLKMRVALGYTYFLKGDEDKAINEFNKVIEIDKRYYEAYYDMGLVYESQDRLDDALEMYQKTTELAPKDHKAFLQKGIVYRKMKMYKQAVESLEAANKMMPGSANIICEIGRVAEDMGDTKSATTIYKEALSYDPLYKDAVDALKRIGSKQ